MKKYRAHGVHARSRFTARHERGREADLANTALTSNTRAQVPPPSSDRPLLPPTLTLPRLRGRKGRGVCHEARLVDRGNRCGQHDGSSWREARRTEFLEKQGYRLLRFWNDELLSNLEGVYATIAEQLAAAPPPNPPPSRGRAL